MSKWISVKDRLPTDGTDYESYILKSVIVCIDGKYVQACEFEAGKYPEPWQRFMMYNNENVTHWQPLPEPPKE